MSRAELAAALQACMAALEAAPARYRIDFEPYWQWQREQQEPAIAHAKAVLEQEATPRK